MMTPHADDMAYDDASVRRDAPQVPAYFLELGAWLEHLGFSDHSTTDSGGYHAPKSHN
jgi:hypothetical protein